MQVALFRDLQIMLPHDAIVFAVPNGGSRNVIEVVNMKRQGLTPGIPDLLIVYRGKVFGLELKSQSGAMTDSQKTMFPKLRTAGMRIEIARSHSEAIQHIRDMAIPLRTIESNKYDAANMFREETRRR